MPRSSYGSGTIFKRGEIWYISYWVNGRQVQKSSRSTNIHDAKRLRDQILGKKARGEMINAAADRITCGELLDDLLEHSKTNVKESTAKIWSWCIEANVRPFFGNIKVSRPTTETICRTAKHVATLPRKAEGSKWRSNLVSDGVSSITFVSGASVAL
jgi:hypothetical protein